MSTTNGRRDQRLKHRAKIKLSAEPNLEMILDMRDLSDSGLYVFCGDTSHIHLNDVVTLQTLEIDDAPILPSKVKRVEDNIGFAVEFMLD